MDAFDSIMQSTNIIIGATVLITLLIFVIVFRVLAGVMRGQRMANELLKNGLPATARILSLGETGISVNDNPAVDIVMEVHRPSAAPYQVKTRMIVSFLRLASIQPGAIVPIKYDAADPTRVVIAL